MKETIKVWAVTLGSVSLSLSNIALIAQIAAAVAALMFTLWQWHKARKKP